LIAEGFPPKRGVPATDEAESRAALSRCSLVADPARLAEDGGADVAADWALPR